MELAFVIALGVLVDASLIFRRYRQLNARDRSRVLERLYGVRP